MTEDLPSIIKDYEIQKQLVSELKTQYEENEKKFTNKLQEFVVFYESIAIPYRAFRRLFEKPKSGDGKITVTVEQ